MMQSKTPNLPPPPGVIRAFVKGFDAVAAHPGVLTLPVLLDFLLWLGPQLKGQALIQPLLDLAQQMPESGQTELLMASLNEFAAGFNLFSVLRTYPFGIYSLMSANLSLQTPLGMRLQLEPGGLFVALLLIFALTALGWLGGALYYHTVASAVFKKDAPSMLWSLPQVVLLSGFWMVFFMALNVPLVILLAVLGLLNATLRFFIVLLLFIPFSWFLLGVFYSVHGLFALRQNVFLSVWNSFRMVRYALPNLGWFSLLAILMSSGLDTLWRVPPADSWMMSVGIFGHAFISTSLLAASFFYYWEVYLWIESALQWLKNNHPSSARA